MKVEYMSSQQAITATNIVPGGVAVPANLKQAWINIEATDVAASVIQLYRNVPDGKGNTRNRVVGVINLAPGEWLAYFEEAHEIPVEIPA